MNNSENEGASLTHLSGIKHPEAQKASAAAEPVQKPSRDDDCKDIPSNDQTQQPIENTIDPTRPDTQVPNLTETPNSSTSKIFSLASFSAEQLRSLIEDQSSRESEIQVLSTLLRTLVKLGDYQLRDAEHSSFVELLSILCHNPTTESRKRNDNGRAPIRLKDAVGRKFSFPWHLCKTWKVCLVSSLS